MFLEISQSSQENTCAKVSFLIKFKKETLPQVFSSEFCETSKNTIFTEHLWTTGSIEMHLVYFFDIFEDDHNIVLDRFETDSVNVMKNRPLGAKKHKEISIYIYQLKSVTSENHGNFH